MKTIKALFAARAPTWLGRAERPRVSIARAESARRLASTHSHLTALDASSRRPSPIAPLPAPPIWAETVAAE